METMNLNYIKSMLIKYDELGEEGNLKGRKQYREYLKKYLKENTEKSCDVYIDEIKIDRNFLGYTAYTIENRYIKVRFICHNNSCEINYNGKFVVTIKL
jgi:hypothetical protein